MGTSGHQGTIQWTLDSFWRFPGILRGSSTILVPPCVCECVSMCVCVYIRHQLSIERRQKSTNNLDEMNSAGGEEEEGEEEEEEEEEEIASLYQ